MRKEGPAPSVVGLALLGGWSVLEALRENYKVHLRDCNKEGGAVAKPAGRQWGQDLNPRSGEGAASVHQHCFFYQAKLAAGWSGCPLSTPPCLQIPGI